MILVRPDEEAPVEPEQEARISRILIPLDGSEVSEAVLPHALELGGHFGAAFHLVRVVPYPVDIASPYLPHTVQMNRGLVDEARSSAEEYLQGHAEAIRAQGHTVEISTVVDAQPGPGIVREAERSDADFIAMATHGRTGLTRAILGSATDKVLRSAHVPLLIIRPEER